MIGFAGLTHLGIIYSLATAAKGFETVAFDPDVSLVNRISEGAFPVSEPGLIEGWTEHRSRLHYTAKESDLAACSVVFIALDVSTNDQHQSDLEPLRALIGRVIQALGNGTTLVLLNQVPPAFTRSIRKEYADLCALKRISILYQVETLVFGQAVARALHPERFIIGLPETNDALPAAYQEWLKVFDCPLVCMRLESAELAKTAINLFLVSTVTTTNFLAELCESLGASWSEIVPALKLDKRIGPHAYLKPGLGISGGNLPRDLVTLRLLAQEHSLPSDLIDTWIRESDYRRDWVLRKLRQSGSVFHSGSKLAVWGMAYIANTGSIKNSAGVALLRALPGVSKSAYDPQVKQLPEAPAEMQIADSAISAIKGADILCVMTPWDEFSKISVSEISAHMKGKDIYDPLGVLDASALRAAGFNYFNIGQSPT